MNPPLADAVKTGQLVKVRTVLLKQALQVGRRRKVVSIMPLLFMQSPTTML